MDKQMLYIKLIEMQMNVTDLAEAIKMSVSGLYKRINGEIKTSSEDIREIKKVLELTTDETEILFRL